MLWIVALLLWAGANQSVSNSEPFGLICIVGLSLGLLVISIRLPTLRSTAFVTLLFSALALTSFHLLLAAKQISRFPAEHESESLFKGVRTAFDANLRAVTADAGGLVAGLAIGDDSKISPELVAQMKLVGLTHLTAVSGANCAIVIGIVYLFLKRLSIGRGLRTIFALSALVMYVLLVGPQPSVMRAAFMAGVVLLAFGSGRKKSSLAALAAAIACLLVVDPWLSSSFGFALSVAATLGILILAPEIVNRIGTRLPKWLSLGVAVSLAAQISCWPILLQLQSGISTYSLIANLLAEPLVAPVTVLGLISCILSPFLPFISAGLSWLASCLTFLIAQIASHLSSLPATTLGWPRGPLGLLLSLALVVAFILWMRLNPSKTRLLAAAACILAVAIISGSSAADMVRSRTWMEGDWDIVSCDVGQGDATVIRSSGATMVIDVGPDSNSVNTCLSNLGVEEISLLVLTHFHADHVGGLQGAASNRSIAKVLITDYSDGGSTEKKTIDFLSRHAMLVVNAYRGMTGTLGDLDWRVLSPRMGAQEAHDQNDGSVSMLFTGAEFTFLTLADIGEPAQMRIAPEIGTLHSPKKPLILKVAHHGSSDQYPELMEALKPNLALISVGAINSYGHPTKRTLDLLNRVGATILRTDLAGSIAVAVDSTADRDQQIDVRVSG